MNATIILLQETHSVERDINIWENEWKTMHMYFNHGNSQSKGVLIAIKKSIDHELLSTYQDNNGRLLHISISIDKKIY